MQALLEDTVANGLQDRLTAASVYRLLLDGCVEFPLMDSIVQMTALFLSI